MCFFGSKPSMPPVEKAAPPPPPPPPAADAPVAPTFNEAASQSTNAKNYSSAKRRGVGSLTIPLGGAPTGAGLQIPN